MRGEMSMRDFYKFTRRGLGKSARAQKSGGVHHSAARTAQFIPKGAIVL
jgi:hypothetical protein